MNNKQCLAIIGLQYGDEGKGKIVDYFSKNYDAVVRFNGGPNAGHTIYYYNKKIVLNQIPSGVFNDKILIIGPECYIDFKKLKKEIELIEFNPKIYIDKNATIITENDIKLDLINKMGKIGTTGSGIGPAASGRCNRLQPTINSILNLTNGPKILIEYKNIIDKLIYKKNIHIIDTVKFVRNMILNGKKILFEGAQSIGLDNIHGDYPYVSQRCTTGGIFSSFGSYKELINNIDIIGVAKQYVTRSSTGPIIKVQEKDISDAIRNIGNEYGSVTNRPRVIGWFDTEQIKKNSIIAGSSNIIITKVDILEKIPIKKICINKYKLIPFKSNDEFFNIVESYTKCNVIGFSNGKKRNDIVWRK